MSTKGHDMQDELKKVLGDKYDVFVEKCEIQPHEKPDKSFSDFTSPMGKELFTKALVVLLKHHKGSVRLVAEQLNVPLERLRKYFANKPFLRDWRDTYKASKRDVEAVEDALFAVAVNPEPGAVPAQKEILKAHRPEKYNRPQKLEIEKKETQIYVDLVKMGEKMLEAPKKELIMDAEFKEKDVEYSDNTSEEGQSESSGQEHSLDRGTESGGNSGEVRPEM